jgi:hypothetical protein
VAAAATVSAALPVSASGAAAAAPGESLPAPDSASGAETAAVSVSVPPPESPRLTGVLDEAARTSFEMIAHQSLLMSNDVVTELPVAAQVALSAFPAALLSSPPTLKRLVPPLPGPSWVADPSQHAASMMLPLVLLVTATLAVVPLPNAVKAVPRPFVWSAPL